MLVPISWLEEYIEIEESPEELAEVLTLAGLEVDAIKQAALGFSGVVVGEVVKAEQHPEADKLRVAEVSVGDTAYQVVCGAANCRAGLKTAFAQIGARLTGDDGAEFKIKKSKLRGVESHGMLCAGVELGMEGNEGILELDPALPVGLSLAEIYGDTVLEISLTPNLGHCMSVRGIARELSALLGRPLKELSTSVGRTSEARTSERVSVSIEEGCWRYCALAVDNVKVGPSPDWLRKRLESMGMNSINNVVDVTNYVMMNWGQPLHAFDAQAIEGGEIAVRQTPEPCKIITLYEETRELPKGTLLIYDSVKPIAIAGVMGGLNSAVQETTTSVILEGAQFCPSSVRRASKLLSLRTDSSARFERGVDGGGVMAAVQYAAALLSEVAGGEVTRDPIDEKSHPIEERSVKLRLSNTNRLLGTTLSFGELESLVEQMNFAAKAQGETLTITIPTWRSDLHEEIDLIEEVARIYGYNNIDYKTPEVTNSPLENDPLFTLERTLRSQLVGEGMQELLCCDLISPEMAKMGSPEDFLAHVLKPSSVDQSVLRPSLLPGLIDVIKRNSDSGLFDLFGFEIGRIHYKDRDHFIEKPMLGIVMTGKLEPASWDRKGREGDFFDMKGVLERLFNHLDIPLRTYGKAEVDLFHPGRQASILAAENTLGFVGEVHPNILAKWGIERRVYYAHVELISLLQMGIHDKIMQPLPLYPGSERDWTVEMDKDKPVDDLLSAIRKMPSRLLKKHTLLDVYEGDKAKEGKKNITVRFLYRDEKKTVAFETVEKEHARILSMLEKQLAE